MKTLEEIHIIREEKKAVIIIKRSNQSSSGFIKDKLSFTNMGDYKIKMELQRLGVSYEIIEDNISLIDENLLEEKIKKYIEKDIRINKKHSGTILKNKIYNHLVSSGYSKEKVISILNNSSILEIIESTLVTTSALTPENCTLLPTSKLLAASLDTSLPLTPIP